MFHFEYCRSVQQVRCPDLELKDDGQYMVWWYGGFESVDREGAHPNLVFLIRKVNPDGTLDDSKRKVAGMTHLGALRIGSLWQRNRLIGRRIFETKQFSLNYSKNSWRYVSLSEHPEHEIFLEHYRLKYHKDKTWLVEFPLGNGGHLLIPCIEFFARLYGHSQECKRILAMNGKETVEDELYDSSFREGYPEVWPIKLKKRLVQKDVVFLAHVKYSDYTRKHAFGIYSQLESQFTSPGQLAFLKAGPWFEGEDKLIVRGVSFNEGKSFLALYIEGASDPDGLAILRDRENSNNRFPALGGASEGKSWDGIPGRAYIKKSEILNFTGLENPDHDVKSVDIYTDAFQRTGLPRKVLDYWTTAKSTKGRKAAGETPDTVSGGKAYGSGGGVGHACVQPETKMEKHGALRDVWNALLYFQKSFPHKILAVEWFTYPTGFKRTEEPELNPVISREDFEKALEIKESKNKIRIGGWEYLDPTINIVRGVLAARVRLTSQDVYFLEIQRRVRTQIQEDGKESEWEEPYKGLVFTLEEPEKFPDVLINLISQIKKLEGKMKSVAQNFKGESDTYIHKEKTGANVPCENSVKNAFRKMKQEFWKD